MTVILPALGEQVMLLSKEKPLQWSLALASELRFECSRCTLHLGPLCEGSYSPRVQGKREHRRTGGKSLAQGLQQPVTSIPY